MRCPQCAGRELQIGVILTGTVTCRFDDQAMQVLEAATFDSFWNPQARCNCPACHWSGSVADAAESDVDLGQIAEIDANDYRTIEQELSAGHCPHTLVPHIERLLGTVRRLNALLEVTRRATRKRSRKVKPASSNDTAVL